MSSCPDRTVSSVTSRWAARLALLVLASSSLAVQAQSSAYPNVGRAATAKEVQAWDIDVRPDFKGLPAGSGSVAKGMDIWESKCASCHGVFGESNEVFSPIVGGTTADDVKTGRVARLNDPSYPGRTTLMKVASVSTLWDYIRRAMPWTQPKSLTVDEVYGVTAYILNMGGVVPDDFTLSDKNIAQVQQRLPNRNGMTTAHGLWPGSTLGRGQPDVRAVACMKDCAPEPTLASFLPDFARDAHGNLAEQNRAVGAQVGADTTRPAAAAPSGTPAAAPRAAPAAAPAAPADAAAHKAAQALAAKYACVACHGLDNKIVGPGFREIAKKYAGRADAAAYLAGKIKAGGSGVWGAIPMPPQTLGDADAKAIAQWLADGAVK
jgi:S-disulfanyl-L-cysteine oxidoreductase SoxD